MLPPCPSTPAPTHRRPKRSTRDRRTALRSVSFAWTERIYDNAPSFTTTERPTSSRRACLVRRVPTNVARLVLAASFASPVGSSSSASPIGRSVKRRIALCVANALNCHDPRPRPLTLETPNCRIDLVQHAARHLSKGGSANCPRASLRVSRRTLRLAHRAPVGTRCNTRVQARCPRVRHAGELAQQSGELASTRRVARRTLVEEPVHAANTSLLVPHALHRPHAAARHVVLVRQPTSRIQSFSNSRIALRALVLHDFRSAPATLSSFSIHRISRVQQLGMSSSCINHVARTAPVQPRAQSVVPHRA
ncbi:hypothetical protein BD626DRAFT_208596 [Schizophyllum amplum]|uniref:Uncharacterized protein n=1 Tax=Schizophyllum amplum TaxID=97359 RepID=A0A550BYP6_9AGAR|nr:hypothetical protein BD626DRAFT_208596 [Auriculariopsis ampla]